MATTPSYKVFNSRHFKRLRVSYLLKYKPINSSEAPFISNIKDLSAGGVKFWTDQPLTEGTFLQLTILIPPLGRTLETLGRVQRVRYAAQNKIYYAGINFVELQTADQEALNRFIEEAIAREEGSEVPQVLTRHQPI